MTGIGMVMAACVSGGAPAALACSVDFTGGAGPINCAGASGNCSQNSSPYGAIATDVSGGTPPYTGGVTLLGDPSGKLAIVPVPGDPFGHTTIGWTGYSLNESEGCYLQYDITDAVGATASARYPSAGVIILKRTS